MKTSKSIGLFCSLSIAVVFSSLGIQSASAQLNEKSVERKASGIYRGGLTGGRKVYRDPNPLFNYTGRPGSAKGKVKVPIKDGRLRSTVRDRDLPGNDKALAKGREKKSTVRRNGNLISVKAIGTVDVRGDHHGPMRSGQITGKTTKKGSKWVADTKMKGKRSEGSGTATYSCKAKGKG